MPKVFHVNWFGQDEDGSFLWPGFGDNLRVLEWILKRVDGQCAAAESAVGAIPKITDLNVAELNLSEKTQQKLFEIRKQDWQEELESQEKFFAKIGTRLPQEIWQEHRALRRRLGLTED